MTAVLSSVLDDRDSVFVISFCNYFYMTQTKNPKLLYVLHYTKHLLPSQDQFIMTAYIMTIQVLLITYILLSANK